MSSTSNIMPQFVWWLLLVVELASRRVVHAVTQQEVAHSSLRLGSLGTDPSVLHQASNTKRICDVLEWGAIGDGIHDDTDAISSCWGECDEITIPGGTYLIAQLELGGSNKVLRLLDGASLIAARDRELYGAVQEDWYAIVLQNCTGCSILGQGSATIDGKGRDWVTGWAPGLEVLPELLPRAVPDLAPHTILHISSC